MALRQDIYDLVQRDGGVCAETILRRVMMGGRGRRRDPRPLLRVVVDDLLRGRRAGPKGSAIATMLVGAIELNACQPNRLARILNSLSSPEPDPMIVDSGDDLDDAILEIS